MDWFVTHLARLKKVLSQRGRTREDSEDLIQEAFLRVKVYVDKGGSVREPEAFLVRTVLNLSRDAWQHEHRELYVRKPVEELALPDRSAAPDELLAAEQCLERLQRALNQLPVRTREIYSMHRLHDLSYAQIAEHFDISISAVEKHIARATSALTQELHP